MTIELMDGHTGEMHISSEDWTVFNTATYGVSGGVLAWGDKFKLNMTTSNKGTVGTGACLVDGKRVWIKTPEDVTVESGGQGVKRHDIVGIQYETYGDGLERAVVKTIKGAPSSSPADPELPAKFLALWRVPLDGITVGEPVQMYKVVPRATDPVTTSRLAANAVTSDKLAPAVRDSISHSVTDADAAASSTHKFSFIRLARFGRVVTIQFSYECLYAKSTSEPAIQFERNYIPKPLGDLAYYECADGAQFYVTEKAVGLRKTQIKGASGWVRIVYIAE